MKPKVTVLTVISPNPDSDAAGPYPAYPGNCGQSAPGPRADPGAGHDVQDTAGSDKGTNFRPDILLANPIRHLSRRRLENK